jgi:hypothetical protein
MNWTGGNLKRFSNKGKGKNNALNKIQKEHFARQRLRLQNGTTAPSPLKFGPFGIRDSFIDFSAGNASSKPTDPQHVGARRKYGSKQTTLKDYESTSGVANRLANMHQRSPENVRRRKRSRSDLQEKDQEAQSRSTARHGYHQPSPSQNLSRKDGARRPLSMQQSKSRQDSRLSHPEPQLQRTIPPKPKFSFLGKDNWVGISTTKPAEISFQSANERDQIGKRRKVTKEDLARKRTPARPRYEPSLDNRLNKDKSWRHEDPNNLLDDISIRIGKPGLRSQDSAPPDQHSDRDMGTQISSDTMLLDNKTAGPRFLTPAHIATGIMHTPQKVSPHIFRSSIGVLPLLGATSSAEDTTPYNTGTPPLPPLRRPVQPSSPIRAVNRIPKAPRKDEAQANRRMHRDPLNQRVTTLHTYDQPMTRLRNHPRISNRRPIENVIPQPFHNILAADTWTYAQELIDSPQGNESEWNGFGNPSQTAERHSADEPGLSDQSNGLKGRDEDVDEENRALADCHPNLKGEPSLESDDEFEPLYTDSEKIGHELHQSLGSHEVGIPPAPELSSKVNESNPLRVTSAVMLSESSEPVPTNNSPKDTNGALLEQVAEEDEPWMRFIFGNDFDKSFGQSKNDANVPATEVPLMEDSEPKTVRRIASRNALLPISANRQKDPDMNQLATSGETDSSLLTEPNYLPSPNPVQKSVDLPHGTSHSIYSNESLRGSDIPSPRRPTTVTSLLSVRSANRTTHSSPERFVDSQFDGHPPSSISASSHSRGIPERKMQLSSPDPLLVDTPGHKPLGRLPVGNLHTGESQRVIFSRPQPFVGKFTASKSQITHVPLHIGRNSMGESTRPKKTGDVGPRASRFKMPPPGRSMFPGDEGDSESISDV